MKKTVLGFCGTDKTNRPAQLRKLASFSSTNQVLLRTHPEFVGTRFLQMHHETSV